MNEKDKKVRVCFVCFRAYPIFNPEASGVFGGAEVDLYLLATELAHDLRFDVRFVTGDYGQPETEQRQGVTLIRSLRVDRNLLLQGCRIWRALHRADADIYMHEACSLATTLVAAFCRIRKRAFVYRTAHTYETDGTYFKQNPLRSMFVKWAFRKADCLLTQNDQDADNLLKTLGLQSTVIKNVVRPPAEPAEDRKTVLWVARNHPIKRPDLFVKMASEFPNVPFVMICPGGADSPVHRKLMQDASAVENLSFIESVPYDRIDAYFSRARVFVSTSDAEGFPNTFVQACSATAAILSLNVNPDGFLDAYSCGFCADGNWDAMIDTLQKWLDTGQDRSLGQNGRKYVLRNHAIAAIIETYKLIFIECASRRKL